MDMSKGTLSVVDKEAMTYSRLWCDYEVATTLKLTRLGLSSSFLGALLPGSLAVHHT